MSIEEKIQEWMISHKKTLACAESCTGGLLASQLTMIPGASDYFLGSLVTYSAQLKGKLLHVKSLKDVVSKDCVREMWQGVLQVTGADFAVAVSGIAGPKGGTVEKPVGTIFYALGFKGKLPEVGTFHINGSRRDVIQKTVARLLELIFTNIDNSNI